MINTESITISCDNEITSRSMMKDYILYIVNSDLIFIK